MTIMEFLEKANPNRQVKAAQNLSDSIMGDHPTLADINIAYNDGQCKNAAAKWLSVHIGDLSKFTGAKNIDANQQRELARIIASAYGYLKVTELLLFFYFFKTGRYGRFYGSVDPMVITCALRDFIKERNIFIEQYEREQNNLQRERNKQGTMSYEQWLEYKKQHSLENKNEHL